MKLLQFNISKLICKQSFFGVLALMLFAVNTTQGQAIFSNPITGTNPNTANPYTTGQTVSPNITVSGIGRGSGITGTNTNNRYNATGWNSGTLSNTKYFEFTLTPSSGYLIKFVSFEYTAQASGTGPTSFSFRSSLDGYGTNIGAANANGTTISLAAAAYQNVTAPITFRLYAWGASAAGGTFSINDFAFNGIITTACTQPTVTSFLPTSAPVNALIKINGSGFMNGSGTSAVLFNGVPATSFTVISNTLIEAVVPVGSTTGAVSITTNNCTGTSPVFTVLRSTCTMLYSDIFISELYDADRGDGGIIELYNGTGATVNLSQYAVLRYGTAGDPVPSYTINLSGNLASGSLYLIRIGNDAPICTFPQNIAYQTGFNADDGFELVKGGNVIDAVNAPDNTGYTMIRRNDVVAPNSVYVPSEWNSSSIESCDDIGIHNYTVSNTTSITTQPIVRMVCEGQSATFSVAMNNPTGVTYQWKMLNSAGVWVNVTNAAPYSGATTAVLTINNVPIGFNGNQYYCFVTTPSCQEHSYAATVKVVPKPTTMGIYYN
ncbi:IPT/TIG domain-containing protein [Flavobacterium sp. WV_118_3]|uniref:IPT/TIG domain-containing protein n=1 Tax=Flavobacterium sp. WV_118_3 TaxID=3151764 RepID=UPI00321A288A